MVPPYSHVSCCDEVVTQLLKNRQHGLSTYAIVVQLVQVTKIKDLGKQSEDFLGVAVTTMNLKLNGSTAMAYGKPYEPVYFTLACLVVSIITGYFGPALRNWGGSFFTAIVACALVINYFIIGGFYKRRAREERFFSHEPDF